LPLPLPLWLPIDGGGWEGYCWRYHGDLLSRVVCAFESAQWLRSNGSLRSRRPLFLSLASALCLPRADFTESMKALGYPRLISVENFRTPNFELVADALYWLVHRYDPSAEIDENISSENHRVEFLKAVATIMVRGPDRQNGEWERRVATGRAGAAGGRLLVQSGSVRR